MYSVKQWMEANQRLAQENPTFSLDQLKYMSYQDFWQLQHPDSVIGRLWGMRCYLAGPMDRVPDSGVEWREDITPFLRNLGIVVLDPCKKPIDVSSEIENRPFRKKLKSELRYDELSGLIRKDIRSPDLAMVDMADFEIVYFDMDVHSCGTYEELFWANRQKDVILCMCKQGKHSMPDWLFGTLPHDFFFGSWNTLRDYIIHVNDLNNKPNTYKRWQFFNYGEMLP